MRSVVLAVPLLLGPAVVACFSGGYTDRARIGASIAAWALLAAAAVLLPRPLPRSRPAILALAGMAALAGWTALSLTWAPLGEPAGEDVQRLLGYVAALAASIAILREPAAARLAEPLLLAGTTGAIAYGLSERLLPGQIDLLDVLSAGDRLAQPLTYWNATGALAAIGMVLAAGVAGDRGRGPAVRAAAAATAPLLGLALYLTFSRGALGALAAGFAVLLALSPTRAQLRAGGVVLAGGALAALPTLPLPAVATARSGSGQGAAMLLVLILLSAATAFVQHRGRDTQGAVARVRTLAAGAVALVLIGTAVVVAQVERGDKSDTPSASPSRLASVQSNRYAYWKVAVRAFGDHPLKGVGSGGFQAEWLRERPFREPVRDAHSLYLETLAELGIVGFALLALVFGSVAVAGRRGPPVALAALATWALHAGLDWDWELPGISLVAVVLAGLVLTSPERAAALGDPGP
jgi:O-antigen ligase